MNLLLVPVGRLYRPPLPLLQRSELAAAFAEGQAARASGQAHDEQHMQRVLELSADERSAYRLGLAGPEGLQAPAPLVVTVPLLLADNLAQLITGGPRPWRQKIVLLAAYIPAVAWAAGVSDRARGRRARALGLTAETAPRLAPISHTFGQLLGRVLLVGIQQLLMRHRTGRWGRVSASSTLAAMALRELRLRRDWHAAYKHRRPPI